MTSLLLFLLTFALWIASYAFIDSIPALGLTLGAAGLLTCLIALIVNHSEHTRKK